VTLQYMELTVQYEGHFRDHILGAEIIPFGSKRLFSCLLSKCTNYPRPQSPVPKHIRYNAAVDQEPGYKLGDVLITIVAEGERSTKSRCWRTCRL
jgi:hypothetical protein